MNTRPSLFRPVVCLLLFVGLGARPCAASDGARIDAISTPTARAGDVVTISGSGFGGRSVRVTVDGVAAGIVDASGTTVKFRVPDGVSAGLTNVIACDTSGRKGAIKINIVSRSYRSRDDDRRERDRDR